MLEIITELHVILGEMYPSRFVEMYSRSRFIRLGVNVGVVIFGFAF